ncbi:neuronal acetylcholine receptor subunit alpha-3-like [Actinia tenebrosa]|uniref:Neuronal acetylcholine receptor subunit alpha-3-like n=1 Tax=Actinia tenebrosa TaxID=6105 RepID=A0A6P8ILA9_ACTTE|nr:neuronal acetylcholine receptor subunit alpha-3-like [Actinia tenebrosa]
MHWKKMLRKKKTNNTFLVCRGFSTKVNLMRSSCCPEPYPDITFYIHIRRDPGFYLFNIIVPCMFLTMLSVLTFLLPPEFGERITLVIESFFAMAVIILNVSDQIPVTSDATPILVHMLLISMFQIGGCLVANAIALNLYKNYEVPEWVRVVILHYLSRCLFMKSAGEIESPAPVDMRMLDDANHHQTKLAGAKHYNGPLDSRAKITTNLDGLGLKQMYDPFDTPDMAKIADGFQELARHAVRENESDKDREFMHFTCIVMDRVFFILFFFILTGSFWKIFGEVPAHYF